MSKTNEKSAFHVGYYQKRLKMRTRKRHEHVRCAHLPYEIAVFAPGENCNIQGKVKVLRQNDAPAGAICTF
jgi:hypothetical protein